jgi:hypothetical protein
MLMICRSSEVQKTRGGSSWWIELEKEIEHLGSILVLNIGTYASRMLAFLYRVAR